MRLDQRVYLNSFPKAGTHLAERFVRLSAAPVEGVGWLGSFNYNAWSTEWVDLERFRKFTENWPAGAYLKGHCGHLPTIAEWLWNAGIASVFVYRNLRDVVISQAYHIVNQDKGADDADKLKHPGKALLAGVRFNEVILACITGFDRYPGIAERWQLYKGWLDERWVLKIRFEEMVQCPREVGERIIRYVMGQTAAFYGLKIRLDRRQLDALIDAQAALIEQTRPATYRRGVVDGWYDEWNPELEAAWIDSGAYAANEALGYEVSS